LADSLLKRKRKVGISTVRIEGKQKKEIYHTGATCMEEKKFI